MKIVFTGGGTGGHFFPIIAIAQELNNALIEHKIAKAELYYISNTPYDPDLLFENNLTYREVPAGKMRLYLSPMNFIDLFKTAGGIIAALKILFSLYPDVVVGKGGFASFPTLVAARILNIPVIIHESDTVPGRVNAWAGKFAKRVAISFPEASKFFNQEKIALTGQPVQRELLEPDKNGAFEYLGLEPSLLTLFITGGSLGSQRMNNEILDLLPELLMSYQVIHQVGTDNIDIMKQELDLRLKDHPHRERYLMYGFMNALELKMSAGASTVIISRAGASSIFNIASWGVPSIIIPITESNGNHQRENAYSFTRAGACVVIEEANLHSHVLKSEILRLFNDGEERLRMSGAARAFFKAGAGRTIADEIIRLALEHEK